MTAAASKQTGVKLGLISLALMAALFAGLFVFGPTRTAEKATAAQTGQAFDILTILNDAPTRGAVSALRAANPGTYSQLQTAAAFAHADDADAQALSMLVLEALFSQFKAQALTLRSADSAGYQAIISELGAGFEQLKSNNNAWCNGATVAVFLTKNDDDLIPSLLSEFPYQSPQYDWAMTWMSTVLNVAAESRRAPRRHAAPTDLDEVRLQQAGLDLSAQQWSLALQIGAFANAEGTSYAQMQDVVGSMNVCELGVAVAAVSGQLPRDVRARIWADLMPELMYGNTPYVIWRVNDYFFIG
ncbi:MAG: hypothetical protein AAFR51_07790 [Pseudomonadota bacterium]